MKAIWPDHPTQSIAGLVRSSGHTHGRSLRCARLLLAVVLSAVGILQPRLITISGMAAPAPVEGGPWVWQNPLVQGDTLNAVSCPTASTCFAGGDFGTILSTDSGGSNWTAQAGAGGAFAAQGISCPTTTTCFAVDAGGDIAADDK
jgi:hypothetical protein